MCAVNKEMQSKIIQRSFDKNNSVFSKWRSDTQISCQMAFNEDIKLWKGYRFIKDEMEVSWT